MDAELFVAAIKAYVHDAALADAVANLERPPGRNPSPQALALSDWLCGLPEADRQRVRQAVAQGVHAAIFGFLCVLDGVRKVTGESGEYELCHVAADRTRLNDPDTDPLHDIYQRFVHEEVFGSPR